MEIPQRPPWTSQAKCLGSRPELFYPDRGGLSYDIARQAKAVCNGDDGNPICPVRQECLDFALVNGEKFGVWGGKSERERNRLRSLYVVRLNAGSTGDHKEDDWEPETVRRRQKIRL